MLNVENSVMLGSYIPRLLEVPNECFRMRLVRNLNLEMDKYQGIHDGKIFSIECLLYFRTLEEEVGLSRYT